MKNFPDHPAIAEVERYGYICETEEPKYDEDAAYDEQKERELFGE